MALFTIAWEQISREAFASTGYALFADVTSGADEVRGDADLVLHGSISLFALNVSHSADHDKGLS
jgi:hypothetical protein